MSADRVERAHRVAWRIEKGSIPEGRIVRHRCGVPGCVEVEHLFLGTRTFNRTFNIRSGNYRRWE
jgi:hypothetical protein